MSKNHVKPASWGGYWKRRKPGARKPDPAPYCEVHGCDNKAVNLCRQCKSVVCGKHISYGRYCPTCEEEGQREEEEVCPFCGQDECDCHDNILGFPENCSKD